MSTKTNVSKLVRAQSLFEAAVKQGGDETSIRQIAEGLALLADALIHVENERQAKEHRSRSEG